jgi:DNA adenine methylase
MTKSFLKWAGGKTRFASTLAEMEPAYSGSYREPFMGSAAVFFALGPDRAVLSDVNEDIVVAFREVKRDPFAVMDLLDELPNNKKYFHRARRIDRTALSGPERAALVIYLNKTCFRGLWRVNSRGEFNVPYGDYKRPYYNRDTLLNASKTLQNATIRHWTYTKALDAAKSGDWLYLDPPYVPTGAWGDFTRYTPDRFPIDEHKRLADEIRSLDERGVHFVLTNADTPLVRQLYKGFPQWVLATRRDIDLRSHKRASRDLVVANYEDFVRGRPPELRRIRGS